MTSPADSPHRHYTASEIEAANDTDLPALLSSLGYHVKRVGRFYTTLEMDSLRVKDRRIWYRYSESIGGDAVAFLRRFHGMSFPEAVRYLLIFNGYSVDAPILPRRRNRPPPQRGRPVFVLPPPHSDNGRVCAYLRGRGISPGIIGSFIKMGLLYEDAEYHNCVFVGRNKAGIPVFATRRGTWGSFKCDVAGSDKRIAFRFPCDLVPHDVRVFEAPIDLMSWFTLYGQDQCRSSLRPARRSFGSISGRESAHQSYRSLLGRRWAGTRSRRETWSEVPGAWLRDR